MIELYNADYRCLGDLEERFGDFIIVTDPPFNIGYHYRSYKDKVDNAEYMEMLSTLIMGRKSVVIHYPERLYELAMESNLMPARVVSWVYNSNTPRQHRDIAFFNITPDFSKVRQPYKNPNDKRIKERIAGGGFRSKTLRLVEYKPGKEHERRENGASMPNAAGSYEKNNRDIAGRCNYFRPVYGQRHNRRSSKRARPQLYWHRARREVL